MKKLLISLLCSFNLLAYAQSFRTMPKDSLVSIEEIGGQEIEIKYFAPMAQRVLVIEDIKRDTVELHKFQNDIWKGVMTNVFPAGYNFRFEASVEIGDAPRQLKSEKKVTYIKSSEENAQLMKEYVPRGAVAQRYYYSRQLKQMRSFYIWTPAGYELSNEPLSVLYLVHGGGDVAETWSTVGSAGIILDNLLAEGKLEPMMVVMPYATISSKKLLDRLPFFEEELMTSILPFVEANYTVRKDAAHRAIMGLSIGGLQTLEVAMHHYDDFDYICALSSGWWISEEWAQRRKEVDSKALRTEQLKKIAKGFNKSNRLLYFTMGGKWDHAYDNNMETMKLFDDEGINYQYSESPGGHTYLVWRKNLYDLAPLLFK